MMCPQKQMFLWTVKTIRKKYVKGMNSVKEIK